MPGIVLFSVDNNQNKYFIFGNYNRKQYSRFVLTPMAGKVENKETLLEGALREAKEETGIPISVIKVIRDNQGNPINNVKIGNKTVLYDKYTYVGKVPYKYTFKKNLTPPKDNEFTTYTILNEGQTKDLFENRNSKFILRHLYRRKLN